jgi:hypothetical protein
VAALEVLADGEVCRIEIFHDRYFAVNVCCTNLLGPALRAAAAAMPAQLLRTMDLP